MTSFLAAHPDDSEAVGRLKNAAEGISLGVATEGLVLGVKALKAFRAGKPEEAMAHLDEAAAKAPPEANPFKDPEQIEMDLPGGGPGKDSPRPEVEANPTAEVAPLRAGKASP